MKDTRSILKNNLIYPLFRHPIDKKYSNILKE